MVLGIHLGLVGLRLLGVSKVVIRRYMQGGGKKRVERKLSGVEDQLGEGNADLKYALGRLYWGLQLYAVDVQFISQRSPTCTPAPILTRLNEAVKTTSTALL